jgi:hypothetical protein
MYKSQKRNTALIIAIIGSTVTHFALHDHYSDSSAVIECGRDENLQQGAAHQLVITTNCRACLRKILQRDLPFAAAHGARTLTSSRCQNIKKLSI